MTKELLISLSILLLSNASTFYLTTKYTVDKVVDNLTYFCYNNRNGAVLEGSNGVYILCQGVRVESSPVDLLDNSSEV